jgi:hypothetical protein
MKKISALLASLAIIIGLATPLSTTLLVHAATQDEVCAGIGVGNGQAGDCNTTTSGPTVNGVIKGTINILSFIIGIAAVVMIIIGGFRYVTAGGDTNAVSGAKSTIIFALVGLVLAAMAQVLVRFVLSKAIA